MTIVSILCCICCICCISCTDNDNVNDDKDTHSQVDPIDKTELQPGTYTFTASPMKGNWEAGDKIYIHGSYGPAAKVITLSAEQINGNIASVDLSGDILDFPLKPDGLYAAYPGQAAKENDSLMDATTEFASGFDGLLCAGYLDGNNFVFQDASSCISFKVSGGFTDFAIAGNTRQSLRTISYTVELTNDYSDYSSRKSDGYPFLSGTISNQSGIIWIPGTMTLNKGYTIYLGKNGEWPATYSVTENVKIKAGSVIDLGDITASITPYSGPAPKMPEMGKLTKYSVKFNELSGICVDTSGDFVWALGDGSQICQISLSGEVLHSANLKTTTGSSIDSEGLSINYDTGDILISGEPNAVCKIPGSEIPNIFKESTFKGVESLFKIADAKNFGNAGAEGCTYYKDGLVYIGTQTGSYLYLCDLATGDVIWRKGLREMHSVITEIAGLSYDPLTDWLWVIDSESHRFFALTGDAEQMLGSFLLKTKSNEESICIDHKNNCIWVGDDYGSTSYIYKYEFTGLDDAIIAK